jgi:hypothetical protein
MVVEQFTPGSVPSIYRRLRDEGRSLPEGLTYVDSWIEVGLGRCFQLMECADARLLQQWLLDWNGMFEVEVVPVVPSKEMQTLVQPYL